MATRKSGPVKPPTLDLEAKKTSARKTTVRGSRRQGAQTKPAPEKSPSAKPTPENAKTASSARKTSAATASSVPGGSSSGLSPALSIGIGVLGGGVFGVILTIALLASGLVQPLISASPDPQLEQLQSRVGINQEQIVESLVGFKALNDRFSTLSQTLEQQTGQLQARLDELASAGAGLEEQQSATEASMQARIAALEAEVQNQTAVAPAPAFDPSPLEAEIAALGARIDAMAAGASTDDAQKIALELADTRTRFGEINAALATLERQSATLGEQLAALADKTSANQQATSDALARADSISEELAGLRASLTAIASQPAQIAPDAVQLPLALMGLEAALENGRPFTGELQSLLGLLPDLDVSSSLMTMAGEGLLRPDEIVVRFNQILPQMLAAQPLDPEAGWQENIWGRIRALLALRPAQGADGDGPEVQIARAEAAVARRDFSGAAQAISQLPLAMRVPLGALGAQFEAMREAENLLDQARTLALTPSPAPSSEVAR